MKSEDTKRIIRKIAKEENLSEWAVELIVKSQFKCLHDIITSAEKDNPETFKSVKINAFATFRVMKGMFKRFKGKNKNIEVIRRKHDAKKLSNSPVLGRGKQDNDKP